MHAYSSLFTWPILLIRYFRSFDRTKQLNSSFESDKIFCFLSLFKNSIITLLLAV